MSKTDYPTICPFCASVQLEWCEECGAHGGWGCKRCGVKFEVRAYPAPEDQRDDIIAQAYQGRIEAKDALRLGEFLFRSGCAAQAIGRPQHFLVPLRRYALYTKDGLGPLSSVKQEDSSVQLEIIP